MAQEEKSEELLSALEWVTKSLKLLSEGKSVKNLDECISHAEKTIQKHGTK